jgi:FO synthase
MTLDSSSGLRRALRRARDGVALDPTEAEILLSARGEDLIDLCASAARVRIRVWPPPGARAW